MDVKEKETFFKKNGKIRPWVRRTTIALVCASVVGITIGGISYSQSFPYLKIAKVTIGLPQGHENSLPANQRTNIEDNLIDFKGDFDTLTTWSNDEGFFSLDIAIETLNGARAPFMASPEDDGYYHYSSALRNIPNDSCSLQIDSTPYLGSSWIMNAFYIFLNSRETTNDLFYLNGQFKQVRRDEYYFNINIVLNCNAIFNIHNNNNNNELFVSQKFTVKVG